MDDPFDLLGLQKNQDKTTQDGSLNIDFDSSTSIQTIATARVNQNQEHRSKTKAGTLHDLDWLGSIPEPSKQRQGQPPELEKSSTAKTSQILFEDKTYPRRTEFQKDFVSNESASERFKTSSGFIINQPVVSRPVAKQDVPSQHRESNANLTSSMPLKSPQMFSIATNEDCSKFFEDPEFCSLLQTMLLNEFSVEAHIKRELHQNQTGAWGSSIVFSGSTIKITEACDKLDVLLKLSCKKFRIFKEKNWWASNSSSKNILQTLAKEKRMMCTIESLSDDGVVICYFMSPDPILTPFCTTENAIKDLISKSTTSCKINLPDGIDQIDIDRTFAELETIAKNSRFQGQICLFKEQINILVFGRIETVEAFSGDTNHIIEKYSSKVIPFNIQQYQIDYLLKFHRDDLLNFEKQHPGMTLIETITKGHMLGYPKSHLRVKENVQKMINNCLQQKFQINNKNFGIAVSDGSYFIEQSKAYQCLVDVDFEDDKIYIESPKSLINLVDTTVCPASMSIDIREGDLSKQAVDMVVVCSTSQFLLENILEKAGTKIRKDFNNAKENNKINRSGLELPGGELLCRSLFFLPWTMEKLPDDKLRASIRDFLDTAIEHAIKNEKTSIAFPAIGCGELGYDAKNIADIILDECQRFANYKLQIIIVLLPNKQSDYEAFCLKLASLRKVDVVETGPKTYQQTCRIINIVATGYQEHINMYRSKMQEYSQKSIITVDCSEFPVHLWNQTIIDKFYRYCIEQRVFINLVKPKDNLTLTGFPDSVRNAQTEFYRLTTISAEEARIASFARIAIWAVEVSPGTVESYPLKINATIEFAHLNHEKSVSFRNENNELCQIDLQSMVENYENRRRTIMRKDFQLPKIWLPQAANVHRTVLQVDDPYYIQVRALFDKTMSGKYSSMKIERIQNRRWYASYNAFKQHFIDPSTREFLFHGCPETSAEMIIHSCFNRSMAGVNGIVYGAGVYFSRNALYSHGFTRPSPKTNDRCMFVVRVLIGKSAKGNDTMRKPPDGYDSTTDGDHIFVTYHDDQAYAHYLITYLST